MQLALPLLLRDKLQWVNDIVVYDPVLTPLEQKAIRALNCTCPSAGDGEEKGRKVDRPTLFFIPHCCPTVTDNVLKANWSRSEMKNIVIIANTLKTYNDDQFLRSSHYLLSLWHALLEIPLPNIYTREPHGELRLLEPHGELRLLDEDDIYFHAFDRLSWQFVDDDRFATVLNAQEKVKMDRERVKNYF